MTLAHIRISALFLTTGVGLEALAGFAAQLVLARWLAPEDFGRFALVLAGVGLILALGSPRIGTLVIRMREADFDLERRRMFFSALFWECLLMSLATALWLATIGHLRLWDFLLAGSMILGHWHNANRSFFERSMPYRRLAAMETGAALISHAAAVAMALAGLGAAALYLREALLALLRLLGLALVGGLTVMRVRIVSWQEWKAILLEARGIWADSLLEAGFQRITILAAASFGGERGAGLFYMAQRLATVPAQLLAPVVARLAATWFSRLEDQRERRAARNRLLLILTPPLVVAALAAVWLADPVVPWLFGAHWMAAAPVLAAMAGLVACMSLFDLMRAYLVIQRWSRYLMPARILQYLGFAIPFLLMPGKHDIVVAGYGLSLAYVAALLSVLLLSWRKELREPA